VTTSPATARTPILSERHLAKILIEYAEHYHEHPRLQARNQRPATVEATIRQPITDLADLRSSAGRSSAA
jgi:hypothetical protein